MSTDARLKLASEIADRVAADFLSMLEENNDPGLRAFVETHLEFGKICALSAINATIERAEAWLFQEFEDARESKDGAGIEGINGNMLWSSWDGECSALSRAITALSTDQFLTEGK